MPTPPQSISTQTYTHWTKSLKKKKRKKKEKKIQTDVEHHHHGAPASGRENQSNTHPLVLSLATDLARSQLQIYGSTL